MPATEIHSKVYNMYIGLLDASITEPLRHTPPHIWSASTI